MTFNDVLCAVYGSGKIDDEFDKSEVEFHLRHFIDKLSDIADELYFELISEMEYYLESFK